jgi:hypothetical protein
MRPAAYSPRATGARRRGKDGKGAFVPEAVASTTTGRPEPTPLGYCIYIIYLIYVLYII